MTSEKVLERQPSGKTTCCDAYSTYLDGGNGEWVRCCRSCKRVVQGYIDDEED